MGELFSYAPTGSPQNTAELLTEVLRCPDDVADFLPSVDLSGEPGYFRLGPDVICYGQCSSGDPAKSASEPLPDVRDHVMIAGSSVLLPFDPVQVVNTLRFERYLENSSLPGNRALRTAYYALRPMMGVSLRRVLQQQYFHRRVQTPFPKWPVDVTVEKIVEQLLVFAMKARRIKRLPFIWFWPQGSGSCTIISHDVETERGRDFCPKLMDLDDSFGIKSSFQLVPEKRYSASESLLNCIRDRDFEINVHDLNHDGHLFSDRERFLQRAQRINQYAKQYRALGFRSAVMYRNVDWMEALDFSYDMSVPNVAHLDPKKGGCCTVLPFFIGKMLELPVTTTQDYSLFHVLKDYSIQLWKEQIARIREQHGLISVIIHPDYIIEDSARRVYAELLEFLCELRARGETWVALPGEVASWWKLRSELSLVRIGDSWRIEGEGCERARVAFAVLNNEGLSYEVENDIRGTSSIS